MTVGTQAFTNPEVDALLARVHAKSRDRISRDQLARLYIKSGDTVNARRWFAEMDALAKPTKRELLDRLNLVVDQGSFDYALDLLVTTPLTSPEVYRLWSYALTGKKQHDLAAAKANEGLTMFPGTLDLHYAVARALFMGGKYVAAAAACETLVSVHPNSGKGQRLWAESLRVAGSPRAAVDRFSQVELADPAFVSGSPRQQITSYYNGWGNALYAVRRYEEAAVKYRLAVSVDSANAVYWNNIAAVHYARDEWYEAVDAYKRAIELDPKDALTLPGLAISEWRAGLIEDAERDFKKAKDEATTCVVASIMCCSCLWRAGRYRDARIEAHGLRERYYKHRSDLAASKDAPALADAAEVFATMLGDFSTAMKAIAEAKTPNEGEFDYAEREITQAVIYFAQAERDVHERRRLSQMAASACRNAIRRLPRPQLDGNVLSIEAELQLIGRGHLMLDELAEAKKYLDAALVCPSPTSDTLLAHALLCTKIKDYTGAIRSFDAALARDSEDVPTRVLLAEALYRSGDFERSEVETRAVLRRAPGTVEAHLLLANVSIEQAEKGDADLFQYALSELDVAWQMMGKIIGSKSFSAAAAASICYLRGFIRTRMYDRQQGQRDAVLLANARDDFRACLAHDPENHHAAIALRKIDERRTLRTESWIGDRLAGAICGVLSLAIFGAAGYRYNAGLLAEGYASLFMFGSMLFLIASFYLPQLMKLKVGSVELEKASVEGSMSTLPLQIRKVQGQ